MKMLTKPLTQFHFSLAWRGGGGAKPASPNSSSPEGVSSTFSSPEGASCSFSSPEGASCSSSSPGRGHLSSSSPGGVGHFGSTCCYPSRTHTPVDCFGFLHKPFVTSLQHCLPNLIFQRQLGHNKPLMVLMIPPP